MPAPFRTCPACGLRVPAVPRCFGCGWAGEGAEPLAAAQRRLGYAAPPAAPYRRDASWRPLAPGEAAGVPEVPYWRTRSLPEPRVLAYSIAEAIWRSASTGPCDSRVGYAWLHALVPGLSEAEVQRLIADGLFASR